MSTHDSALFMDNDAYEYEQWMNIMKKTDLSRLVLTGLIGMLLSGCQNLQQFKFADVFNGTKSRSEQHIQQTKHAQIASSNLPLAQILKIQPDLLNTTQQSSIQQVFNHLENPTAAQVTVIQSGLLDDSVRAIRIIYQFKKNEKQWFVVHVEKSYQCARGAVKQGFQTTLCP